MWQKLCNFLSVCYVLGALCLLVLVCCRCYPDMELRGRKVFAGSEDSPARAAFSVLSEELGHGSSFKESVVKSYEVLFGEEATD